MRIAVLQPSYLPWLGYLDQIARSDAFIFYDDVQFDKNGWRNRNRIRNRSSEGCGWLTVPVRLSSHFPKIIEVEIDTRVPWQRKHLATLASEYARAPFHERLIDFTDFFKRPYHSLADAAIDSVRALMKGFKIATPLYRSSQLGLEGDRNTRLLNLCKHFGATHYLSGVAARTYLDVPLFKNNGITVEWQSYEHPTYPQRYEPFISHLSAIDALLNVGPAASRLIDDATLTSTGRKA